MKVILLAAVAAAVLAAGAADLLHFQQVSVTGAYTRPPCVSEAVAAPAVADRLPDR